MLDAIAQAVESAVIQGDNMATLMTSTKNFLAAVPREQAESLIAALPVERRDVLLKKLNS